MLSHQQQRAEQVKRLEQKKAELAAAMEEARLQEQARRNAVRAQQEIAEVQAYEKAYGKVLKQTQNASTTSNVYTCICRSSIYPRNRCQ